VYALDSTTIDLCLSVFPWAHFRTTKAAVKMHTLHLAGAFFVTRAKSNIKAHRVYSTPTDRTIGIVCDQRIALDGFYTRAATVSQLAELVGGRGVPDFDIG
jgi:hypothetical protein